MSTPIPLLIQLLDAFDTAQSAVELRAHSYELLRLRPGAAVVDVGCGSGRAVAELADLGAAAMGVDPNEQMLDVARNRWPASDFQAGTAEALPLPDASVSGYRADKVFHVLPDPAAALAEAERVLVPGGRIVLMSQDWAAYLIDSTDDDTTRALVHARANKVTNPTVARAYRNLLLDSGFRDVTMEVRTPVFTDELMIPMLTELVSSALDTDAVPRERAEAWLAEQTARAAANRLMVALPLFIAAATRAD
ncbi:methyltransferase domain-containing protein [Nocardia altamirensis]|uniref:methyltransferase domain-containing protein n=1 Tax=Nocardia altamirensis TaxID=472158 RepID=UPI000A47CCF5|nr:methyltransferase domain-containing protein [Nocardia altamirensis]